MASGTRSLIACTQCNQTLKFDHFSKSQRSKKSPRCKPCVANTVYTPKTKKKIPKTAHRASEVSITDCQQCVTASLPPQFGSFGVEIANIILSYSHILIEGIYRSGHEDDEQWRANLNDSRRNYNQHKLVLKPSGKFFWKWAYWKWIYPRGATGQFEAHGCYEIVDHDKVGGATTLKLRVTSQYNYSWYRPLVNDVAFYATIDCDKELVMSLAVQNRTDDGNETTPFVFQKLAQHLNLSDWHDIEQKGIQFLKPVHSIWYIPK